MQDVKLLAVSAKELAAMMRVGERTVHKMHAAGKLPRPVTISGRLVRWRVAEIEAWLAAGAPDREAWEAVKA